MSRRLNSADAYWDTLGHENSPSWMSLNLGVAVMNIFDDAMRTGFVHPGDQNTHLINHIDPSVVIDCPDITIGVGVTIERGTRIKAGKLVIGDFAYIGDNVTLRAPEVRIGDYTRVNALTYGGGRKTLSIGRNVYLGRGVYLDSNGGLTLEDNTAAGAYSQLWTHIQHGDLIQGLNPRWHQERALVVHKDAWLVGRVVVSHAQDIGARALVLNESNVLCDIPADTTWAGNPAKDMTDKLGRQFQDISEREKLMRFDAELSRFEAAYPQFDEDLGNNFDPVERLYTKRRTAAEVAFLRFTSGKFTPVGGE